MLIGNARAKKKPTQVVEINGERRRACCTDDRRRPHPGITDFLSKGEADRQTAAAGTRGTHENAVETHIVILAMVYLPNVGGTCAERSRGAAMRARGSIGCFEARVQKLRSKFLGLPDCYSG